MQTNVIPPSTCVTYNGYRAKRITINRTSDIFVVNTDNDVWQRICCLTWQTPRIAQQQLQPLSIVYYQATNEESVEDRAFTLRQENFRAHLNIRLVVHLQPMEILDRRVLVFAYATQRQRCTTLAKTEWFAVFRGW